MYQYLDFCYNQNTCDVPTMAQSLMSKIFQVTTIVNDFAQIVMEGLPSQNSKPSDIEAFADRIGSDVGKLIRYATDFDPSQVSLLQ